VTRERAMRIYVAGHTGLVGSAMVRGLERRRDVRLITRPHRDLDLTDGPRVLDFLERERPDVVVAAAAMVGGIGAHGKTPAVFFRENIMIEANLIHASWKAGVKHLLNFGSVCMYPQNASLPLTPGQLMTGRLEAISEPFAMAKLGGLSMCGAYNRQYGTRFVTVIPCHVYGPGDNFDREYSHVIGAFVRKFHEAKVRGDEEITLWGSGRARREFVFSDDLAEACELILEQYRGADPVNIGSGTLLSIRELAQTVAAVVEFRGRLMWDTSRPDGGLERGLDSTPVRRMGWKPRTDLVTGLEAVYKGFQLQEEDDLCEIEEGNRSSRPVSYQSRK